MAMQKMVLVFFLTTVSTAILGFETLDDIIQYSKANFETPEKDSDTGVNDPDYRNFYTKMVPGFWAGVKEKFKKPLWSSREYHKLLEDFVKNQKNDQIEKLIVSENSTIIVVGDLQGSFHSLARLLQELYNKNIINKNLEIVKRDCYITVLGAVGIAPYNMQMLTVLLLMLKRNPGKFFYCKAKNDQYDLWLDHTFKTQLEVFTGKSIYKSGLYNVVSKFFKNLWETILIQEESSNQVIALSGIYSTTVAAIKNYNNNNKNLDIIALVKPYSSEQQTITKGLDIESFEGNTVIWNATNTPHKTYGIYNLSYDSYSEIIIKNPLNTSIIIDYDKDITQSSFTETARYLIAYGRRIDKNSPAGLPSTKIKLGTTLDLSIGSASLIGRSVKNGLMIALNEINKTGVFPDKTIELFVLDDKYIPIVSQANIQTLREKSIDIFICPEGAPTLEVSLDLIRNGDILVLFPITGSDIFRKPDLKGVVNFRASYAKESEALINYLFSYANPPSIAFFYQNDSFGRSGLTVAQELLKNYKGTTLELPFPINTADFSEQVKQFKKTAAEVIFFFCTDGSAAAFIRQCGVESFISKQLFGFSDLGSVPFKKFLFEKGLKCTIAEDMPNPATSTLECVEEFRKLVPTEFSQDPFVLEGFLAMGILADAFKQISGPITKESVVKVFESYKDYNYKGLVLTFDPQTRSLANRVWLDLGDNNWKLADVKTRKIPA